MLSLNLPFGQKTDYKIGIALSGGGARGFAHVGALQALEDMGVKPDLVCGVSAGSVVAALYASGMRPAQMIEIFSQSNFLDFTELSLGSGGLFKLTGFRKFLQKNIPYKNIEDLPLKTVICATNLDKCEKVAFEEGELSERICASCCMPVIFKPVRIDGTYYVDGGVLHNLPAWAVRDRCKYLIGINCSPMPHNKYKQSLASIAMRTYTMMAKSNVNADMALCDLAVPIENIANYQVFDLGKIRQVYSSGYLAMMDALVANGFRRPEEIQKKEPIFKKIKDRITLTFK